MVIAQTKLFNLLFVSKISRHFITNFFESTYTTKMFLLFKEKKIQTFLFLENILNTSTYIVILLTIVVWFVVLFIIFQYMPKMFEKLNKLTQISKMEVLILKYDKKSVDK